MIAPLASNTAGQQGAGDRRCACAGLRPARRPAAQRQIVRQSPIAERSAGGLAFEDDPNLTDKKFPGNPTKSFRTTQPLRIVGELAEWQGHPPEQLKTMRDGLERLKEQGVKPLD